MKRTRRRGKPNRRRVRLDSFSTLQFEEGLERGDELQNVSDRVYFDLERQRAAKYEELCASLRERPGIGLQLRDWVRVIDWRWSLTPLSAEGSTKGIGGRFNIGEDLDRARGQAFRALYIAENLDTAYSEYLGAPLTSGSRLSIDEFALRTKGSFTTFILAGELEQILDLRTTKAIDAFSAIVSGFSLSRVTISANHRASTHTRFTTKTPQELRNTLLEPPSRWRLESQAFGIPSTCQIFGRFVRDAGFEGILFPSQVGAGLNLALYPENFRGGLSKLVVIGDVPQGATHTRLDSSHC